MVQRQGKYYFIRLVVQLGSLSGSVPLTNSLEMLVRVSSMMAGSSFKMCLQKTQINEVSEIIKFWNSPHVFHEFYMALSKSSDSEPLCLCFGASRKCRSETLQAFWSCGLMHFFFGATQSLLMFFAICLRMLGISKIMVPIYAPWDWYIYFPFGGFLWDKCTSIYQSHGS